MFCDDFAVLEVVVSNYSSFRRFAFSSAIGVIIFLIIYLLFQL